MQPVPGHGGAPRGACEPRGGQRHGRAGTVRARDGGHGAPGAHPGLGDGLRVDPAAPGRPGKHLPGAPHGPPGQVADVGPLRPAPAHDEGADAVPLVHDGQGGATCLLGQRADVVRAAPRSPADPGLAPPGRARRPGGRTSRHPRRDTARGVRAGLPACASWRQPPHGSAGHRPCQGDTRIALPHGMPRGTSLSVASPAGHHPPAAAPPGPSAGAGQEGRPGEVGQRPRRGAICKVGEIKGVALLKTPQLGEVPRGHL
jgi:hypothetical protein